MISDFKKSEIIKTNSDIIKNLFDFQNIMHNFALPERRYCRNL